MAWINRYSMAMAAPAPLSQIVRAVNRFTANLPLGVTQRYLERRFRDPQLRAVVTSQWADYGVPPGQSAFATHAVIASHHPTLVERLIPLFCSSASIPEPTAEENGAGLKEKSVSR